jgi:hypothetical protein
LFRLFIFGLSLSVPLLLMMMTPLGSKVKRGLMDLVHGQTTVKEVVRTVTREVPKEVVREVIKKEPPPPLPSDFVPRSEVDTAKLFNGIQINTHVQTVQGTYARLEALDPSAYQVKFEINVRVPKANQSVEELARINSELPRALPGLATMLPTSKVSGFYHKLYQNKIAGIERDITRLNKILDRHNFFDTETILEMQHPTSGRRALMIQTDMDVVADGSDGDRMADLDDYISMSSYYQPMTSYFWKKQTKTPNPLLGRWQSKLKDAKAEYAQKGLSTERNKQLKATISTLSAEIEDFKNHSSLIADTDPFIVLSLLFRGYSEQNAWTPQMGDYAVVIHGNQILPAICGDYGPSMKMGEASLFIAKQVNPKATPNQRGEDDLKATYLIFPGTAKKPFGPPNLEDWRNQCIHFLTEIGGIGSGFDVHNWPDLIKWKREFVGPPWPLPKPKS